MFGKKKEEKTLTTNEALHMLKNLITCDVDECCMASMDKDDVIEKLEKIKKYLEKIDEKQNPKELKTAVLLRKQECQVTPFSPDYCCFEIPDVFVVGYGLDYDNRYRNLPYVAALENEDLSEE